MSERNGDWMQTYTGRQFWPLDPRPEDVHIEDIAHALAMLCRFGGHATAFYSVAQHSVLVSRIVSQEYALIGLLHDAAEAYIGDMVRPLKHANQMHEYRRAEERISRAIAERYGLPWDGLGMILGTEVKAADDLALATEARDVMDGQRAGPWRPLPEPMHERIRPWGYETAERAFILRFSTLWADHI